MVTQACKLNLSQAHPTSVVSSLLFEPTSRSVALMHTDSSILLHPSISPFFSPSSSPSPTSIPPPATSASFLRIQPSASASASPSASASASRVLFLVASPHHSYVLLRAWILRRTGGFAPSQLNFKCGGDRKSGAVLDLSHGFSIKIAGSVNVFVVHSPSAKKIWVLSARLVDLEDDRTSIDLIKCGVIECTNPICTVFVSMWFLILGEEHGVRVLPLRPIVKGRVRKKSDLVSTRVKEDLSSNLLKNPMKALKNGLIGVVGADSVIHAKNAGIYCNGGLEGAFEAPPDGCERKADADHVSAKRRTVKLRQDSGELGSFFVVFKVLEVDSVKCKPAVLMSLRAVSVHALSQRRFLILDSVGDVHLLNLHNVLVGSEVTENTSTPFRDSQMRRLECTMKVQMLAVVPDISIRTHTIWVSDGCHSVHMVSIADMVTTVGEGDKDENEEKLMQISGFKYAVMIKFVLQYIYLTVHLVGLSRDGPSHGLGDGTGVLSHSVGVTKYSFLLSLFGPVTGWLR